MSILIARHKSNIGLQTVRLESKKKEAKEPLFF